MWPRGLDDQVKQQEVVYLITSYTFVASLHFMLDVVGACAGMLQIMQVKRPCVALEDLSVEKCVEALDRAERWEGPGWTDFQKDFVPAAPVPRFLCVPLHGIHSDFPTPTTAFWCAAAV
jgi:hypothetical protein